MINELYHLSQTLDSKGIEVSEWHRKYKEIPKVTVQSPCVRIWLDDDGAVCGIERLTAEHVSRLRKYGDNQSSFPAFNISSLYRIVDENWIHELENMESGKCKPDIEKIRSWCSTDNWIKGAPRQVKRSLKDCPEHLLKLLNLENQAEHNIIAKLAELCQKYGENAMDHFRASLENFIFELLNTGEDTATAFALLFHKGSAKKEHGKDVGNKISIVLDVKNWRPYSYPVASEYTTNQLNKMLLESNTLVEAAEEGGQVDAFGSPFANPNEPMPNVKLSGFDVTLRSMFEGQPCQRRYNKINDGSYPIAAENRSSIKRSLEWISKSVHRQITWEKIDKDEMVFIYPNKLPQVPPRFASILGQRQTKNSSEQEARFESVSKDFAVVFRGLPTDQKPDVMQLFSIRKIDKARSKVIFTHNTTPERLIQSADDWAQGARNLPKLDVGEIITPFPLEIADIVNAVWKQNGERADGKKPVERMKYYQGMELLLDIPTPNVIHNLLHIHVENSVGLISFVGNKLHQAKSGKGKIWISQKEKVAQASCVLALLLFKHKMRRESYMEELAYLIGQLLHVSDELHVLYCKVKRNGDIPPQLAGNSLFIAAGSMPFQAISQLAIRMNPYISWAEQYRFARVDADGVESWRAVWLLGLFQQIADKIKLQMNQAVRFGDFEKAQLFIGYIASLPK